MQSLDFKKQEPMQPPAAPTDLATTYRGLTAKAFAVPANITTDAKFAKARKAFLQSLYRIGEAKWCYAVPSFVPTAQATDPYLQQMKLLIAGFVTLADWMNEILRDEIVLLIQADSDSIVRQLPVPPVKNLIQFQRLSGERLPSTLEQKLPPSSLVLEKVKTRLDLAVNTSLYRAFVDRFGKKDAFINAGREFDGDREKFYRSIKMNLELILQIYRQQYQDSRAPDVSPFARQGTWGTIRDFLRELQKQSLKCADGMAFIGDTFDQLTRGNTPEHWLATFRTDIVYAAVRGAMLQINEDDDDEDDVDYQIHAQTAVVRVAVRMGFGIASCLPFDDQHGDDEGVQLATGYAFGRLLVEFPHNYNYETVCHYVADKLWTLAREAVQELKGQVIQSGQQYQDICKLLTIKLRNPPLSFTGLTIEQLFVHSEAENIYRIDERLCNTEDYTWLRYFLHHATQLLIEREIIQPFDLLSSASSSSSSSSSNSSSSFSSHSAPDEMDKRLSTALNKAIEQRRLYELFALLEYLHDATKVVTPEMIRRALDAKYDKRIPLPPPARPEEAPYHRKESWQPQVALRYLMKKLPDSAFEAKKASDHLLVIGLEHAQIREFNFMLGKLQARLAPKMGSVIPTLTFPKVTHLENDEKDAAEESKDSFKVEQCRSLQNCSEQIGALQKQATRLMAYANLPVTSPSMGENKALVSLQDRDEGWGEGLRSSFLTEFILSAQMTSLLMEKVAILWRQIPYLEFPFTHWHPEGDLPKNVSQVVTSLRTKKSGELPDQYQDFVRWFAGKRAVNVMKTIYFQCGANSLPLLQHYCAPTEKKEEAKSKEISVANLLEYARYAPVDLSARRWLMSVCYPDPPLIYTTPLRTALRNGRSQQFLQLLAAGADPTIDSANPEAPTLLIALAAPTYANELFVQLLHRLRQFKGQDEKKTSDYINRRSASGDTALRVLVQHQQFCKLMHLLLRFKDVEMTSLPEYEKNSCWDWLDLVIAIREKRYTKALSILLSLYDLAIKRRLDDVALDSSRLSPEARRDELARQNRLRLEQEARYLCKVAQQQGGEGAIPFLTYLAQQTDEVDLLLVMRELTPEAKVDFNAPRPGVESLLHRAIREGCIYHANALWEGGADPTRLIEGISAWLCAVQTGNAQMIMALLAWKKAGEPQSTIVMDQEDAKGRHALSYVAESSHSTLIFTKVFDRFIKETEAKEESGSLAARRQAVLLSVVQQLLQHKQRHILPQMKKFIMLLTNFNGSQLTDEISDEPKDKVYHLLHVIRAAKAGAWAAAMDHYCFYCWHMELSVDDPLSDEFLAMLQHQGYAEFSAQLAAQRAHPTTGLLQVSALLRESSPAVTQFIAWISAQHIPIPQPREAKESASVSQSSFRKRKRGEEHRVSERSTPASVISQNRKRKREEKEEKGEIDVAQEQEQKELGFLAKRARYSLREGDGSPIHNDAEVLLSSLRSFKVAFMGESSSTTAAHFPAYQKFIGQLIKQLGICLPKDIHHYPQLFAFILQEVTDPCTPIFTYSSDKPSHSVYYTPLGYVIRAQLEPECCGYVERHQRGEEVGMSVVADSLHRTPLMLAATLTTATAPVATVSVSAEQKREGKHEKITPEEQREREEKERKIAAQRGHEDNALLRYESKDPENKTVETKGERKQLEVKVKEKDERVMAMFGTVAPTQSSSSSSSSSTAPITSASSFITLLEHLLLTVRGVGCLATDLIGNHVLHCAIQGSLENFITIAHHVGRQLALEQWRALVRQPNQAGDTILSLAAAQADSAKVLGFLSLDDIEVATFDLTPYQHLPMLHHLVPLLQEIKQRNEFIAAGDGSWDQFEFPAFGLLWQSLVQQEGANITSVLFMQLIRVIATVLRYYGENREDGGDCFCEKYFTNMITKQISQMPKHHLAQPLLALLRLCSELSCNFVGEGGVNVLPALFALRQGEEEITRQLICDELEGRYYVYEQGTILQNILDLGSVAQFAQVVSMYYEFGGCKILDDIGIFALTCSLGKASHAQHLMTIESLSLTKNKSYENTNLELVLEQIKTFEEDSESDGEEFTRLTTLHDTLLTKQEVLKDQYQKSKRQIQSGSILTNIEGDAAVLSLHHLVRLGQVNFRDELDVWLDAKSGRTVMGYLLDMGYSENDDEPIYLLMQLFQSEFKQLTDQLNSPQAASGFPGHRVFSMSLLPPPAPDLKAIKALAKRVAVEMTKYYGAAQPVHQQAAASLRTFLQTDLAQLAQLDPAVWQIPELTQLLTALGVHQPPAPASVATVAGLSAGVSSS